MSRRRRSNASDREVARLPMPDHLEPKDAFRSLMSSVRIYFYTLYNATDKTFRNLLASVGNKDSITGNRLFDRYEAVAMVKTVAGKSNDAVTEGAKPGDIYRCIVNLLRQNDMGLRIRRREYQRLTHQAPAE